MSKLIPPANFAMVEEDLYRSGQPNELNFPFLEKLHLKMIIYLAPDEPTPAFRNFVEDQEIQFWHLGMEGQQNPWNPMSEEVILQALGIILDPKNYPLAVMCNMGRHRTGTVIGCLRKLQRWNMSAIFEEYRRCAGNSVRVMNEQFVELFDTELVTIPVNHVKWL